MAIYLTQFLGLRRGRRWVSLALSTSEGEEATLCRRPGHDCMPGLRGLQLPPDLRASAMRPLSTKIIGPGVVVYCGGGGGAGLL